MKITICTTPIRPVPTDYPPFGSMAIIQSLQSHGYHDIYFYDIDGLRPTFDEVVRFFEEQQPDVVGISAVVSTAYEYTKRLAKALRKVVPNVTIVVGGNLAASAEILHRLCGVDFCVIGEGEKVIVNLMRYIENRGTSFDDLTLRQIKGISFLDRKGDFIFTGYETAIAADQLFDPDYTILEKFSKIDNFVKDPLTRREDFARDPRSRESHRHGKKMGNVLSAKGCVARCTFCHRWDKGYRHFPPGKIISRIKYLMDRYNVGFINFADENFGSDRRALDELIELVQSLDILYIVSGVRVRSVDLDLLKRLKKSGCVAVYYGMETGSPTILKVMEKGATVDMNYHAARWTFEAGIYTTYQLVLAMPGETPQTISETTDFMKSVTQFLPEYPQNRISCNYIQALPGTPVYENARVKGFLGKTLEDEEKYLMLISNVDARDDTKFLNFTDTDYFTVQSWRRRLVFEVMAHYLKYNNMVRLSVKGFMNDFLYPLMLKFFWPSKFQNWKKLKVQDKVSSDDYSRGGYFNFSTGYWYYPALVYLYRFRTFIIWYQLLRSEFLRLPKKVFILRLSEFFQIRCLHIMKFKRKKSQEINKSLRKIMQEVGQVATSVNEQSMQPLREGR